ncbi:MAG TPA: AraC family transcriptional regulator [Polyangiaceae bacterium]|nr:AraC family transcriptional regulator [Polyangiaceae bacterium]
MSGRANASTEVVGYRRSEVLPGVEAIDAQRSPRQWRVITPDYAIVVFRTWRGSVRHRGQVHAGEPGLAFCYTPGEAMVSTPQGAGSFNVLQLESEVLKQLLSEQQPSSVRLDWAAVMKPISGHLRNRFAKFFEIFEPTVSAMQMQSQLLELSEIMLSELVQGARQPRTVAGPPNRGAARMRECLNEEGLNMDLETLAKQAGLSRFEALRAFKKRYGLPPHAYQLCLRINHSRRLLLEGVSPADVAARCGFADQSHYTRHFKRFVGVTPMQYALAHRPSSSRPSGTYRIEPSAVLERSDR